MKKFLYFAVSAPNDAGANEQVAMFPVDSVSHFEIAETTKLDVWMNKATGQEANEDGGLDNVMIRLLITSGKHKEVMDAIANAINFGQDAMLVVADTENAVYLHSDITACESISVVDAS
tara:strand:+ start:32 stop:388 length:357 start_codon:yes stop_codon:yes gene_type:complete